MLKESERIKESLRSLTEEFIEEYPYYSTWIEKNKATFKDGTRVVYELKDNEKTVGYMMVHFSTQKCAKVNGIYVFPDCQKRGYAKKALLQVLEELRKQNYDYAFIQTRTHNKIVVHIHAHYDWQEFDKDRRKLFDKFNETLCGLVNIEINLDSAMKVKEYSNEYSNMYYSVGIHPMEVEKKLH